LSVKTTKLPVDASYATKAFTTARTNPETETLTMHSRRLLLAPLLATLVAASVLSPAVAQAAPEQLRLADLDKGPAPTVPYVVDRVLHDGAVSVQLPRGITRFLGKAGDDYLVQGYNQASALERVVRITPAGARTVLVEGTSLSDATLSPDGATFVASKTGNSLRTTLRRFDAGTGAVTLRHKLDDYANVLDYDGTVAVVGGFSKVGTALWDVNTDEVTQISTQPGVEADLAADRLARLTKDPSVGGCTVVSALSRPNKVLWRSCEEVVVAFSPDGSRIATVHILSDGLGPSRFTLRKTAGRKLAVYDAPYYFGGIWFEDGRHILADAFAKTKGAIVRCDGDGCERATSITAHEVPLLAAR
jgi:hypothetical protein